MMVDTASKTSSPANPSQVFLAQVQRLGTLYLDAAGTRWQQSLPLERREELERHREQRAFEEDIVERVKMLAYAYDRFLQLGPEYEALDTKIRQHQTHPTGRNLAEIPAELLQRERNWRLEAEILTAFAVYEIKSVVDMLGGWNVVARDTELAYLLKVRNFFLAHPKLSAFFRLPRRSIGIPVKRQAVVTQDVIGLNRLNEHHQQLYACLHGVRKEDVGLVTIQNENERMIRQHGRAALTAEQKSRLLGWGAREPDLRASLVDLAQLLQSRLLPDIQRSFKQATQQFRYGQTTNAIPWPY